MNASRTGDWILTFMNQAMYPLDPRPEEIRIEDIAHALSNICRFNGHTREFYSVAEHSCLVHDIAYGIEHTLEDCRCALMHDAGEAYLCDIPRPLKLHETWPQMYHDAEERLMQVISQKYGFKWPMPDFLGEIDDRVLGTEFQQLLPSHGAVHLTGRLLPYPGLYIHCWNPVMAEQEFLHRFRRLFGFAR